MPVFNRRLERGRRTRESFKREMVFFWERALGFLRRWSFGDAGFVLKRKNVKKKEHRKKKMLQTVFFETVNNL
jgi:hypothetical protein